MIWTQYYVHMKMQRASSTPQGTVVSYTHLPVNPTSGTPRDLTFQIDPRRSFVVARIGFVHSLRVTVGESQRPR